MIILTAIAEQTTQLYRADGGLSGYQISAEKNPGGIAKTTVLEEDDVAIRHTKDYSEVTANPLRRRAFVNAVGTIKFLDRTPDGSPVRKGKYSYECQVRLPSPPKRSGTMPTGDTVGIRLRYCDATGDHTLDGGIFWAINPAKANYSHILLVSSREGKNVLVDTGVIMKPDDSWRRFSVGCDLNSQMYTSVSIDNLYKEIKAVPLVKSSRGGGEKELALRLTIEATNALVEDALAKCPAWSAQFRNARLFWVP